MILFLIIKSVLDRFDLYGLLEGGAPKEEFDEESKAYCLRDSNLLVFAALLLYLSASDFPSDYPKILNAR